MDAIKLVREDERPAGERLEMGEGERVRLEVDPDTMYPAALKYARELVADTGGGYPAYLGVHVEDARAVPERGWELAEQPAEGLTAKQREDRAAALEAARRIFTAVLHRQVGQPLGLRILKSERWRL